MIKLLIFITYTTYIKADIIEETSIENECITHKKSNPK